MLKWFDYAQSRSWSANEIVSLKSNNLRLQDLFSRWYSEYLSCRSVRRWYSRMTIGVCSVRKS